MASSIVSTVVAGVIGALVSLFIERAWRRHKAKQKQKEEEA
jgi:uncharacterized membrane protein YeaQ/YmgE (transglycosylase-associated protein family)